MIDPRQAWEIQRAMDLELAEKHRAERREAIRRGEQGYMAQLFQEMEIQIDQFQRINNGRSPSIILVSPLFLEDIKKIKGIFGERPGMAGRIFNLPVETVASLGRSEFIIGEKHATELQDK